MPAAVKKYLDFSGLWNGGAVFFCSWLLVVEHEATTGCRYVPIRRCAIPRHDIGILQSMISKLFDSFPGCYVQSTSFSPHVFLKHIWLHVSMIPDIISCLCHTFAQFQMEWNWFQAIIKNSFDNLGGIVDGRNPAPPGTHKSLVNNGMHKSLVNNGINDLSTGAGFLPLTVFWAAIWAQCHFFRDLEDFLGQLPTDWKLIGLSTRSVFHRPENMESGWYLWQYIYILYLIYIYIYYVHSKHRKCSHKTPPGVCSIHQSIYIIYLYIYIYRDVCIYIYLYVSNVLFKQNRNHGEQCFIGLRPRKLTWNLKINGFCWWFTSFWNQWSLFFLGGGDVEVVHFLGCFLEIFAERIILEYYGISGDLETKTIDILDLAPTTEVNRLVLLAVFRAKKATQTWKTKMTMGEESTWRCIVYWKWWFSIVMLVFGEVIWQIFGFDTQTCGWLRCWFGLLSIFDDFAVGFPIWTSLNMCSLRNGALQAVLKLTWLMIQDKGRLYTVHPGHLYNEDP